MGGKSATMDSISSQPTGTITVDSYWQEMIKQETAQRYAAWKRVAELQSKIANLELELIETKEKLDATQAVIDELQRRVELGS